jgi:hypothetical protein
MDPNNYKIPPKKTINYSPKLKPKIQTSSLEFNSKTAMNHNKRLAKPATGHSQRSTITQPKITSKHQNSYAPKQLNAPVAEAIYTAPVKIKKKAKSGQIIKKATIVCIVIALITLLIVGGYIGIKKYQKSREIANSTVKAIASSTAPQINNPIVNSDFIVYGTKASSLFVTNKTDYQQDQNALAVKVVAKSSYINDKREITINQQKVASNFDTEPEGLKKIADSIGPNTSLSTSNGTSYIISDNATGITNIGKTLISVKASASLALAEWQQIFSDLEPIQI